jgi:hypothetical protein
VGVGAGLGRESGLSLEVGLRICQLVRDSLKAQVIPYRLRIEADLQRDSRRKAATPGIVSGVQWGFRSKYIN